MVAMTHRIRGLSLAAFGLMALVAPSPADPISYTREVRPILERSCMSCHACYDAPCQLKMESAAGIERGRSKAAVYDGARVKDAEPTRLGVDAASADEWRKKGFLSVIEGGDKSLMAKMLELGRTHTMTPHKPVPKELDLGVDRKCECPDQKEFDAWAAKHPQEGMPLAVAPLPEADYQTLRRWLKEGAPIDAEPEPVTAREAQVIEAWEGLLNRDETRARLVARYLYEHLFLAHLYFDDGSSGRFFEVVRSKTPPGAAIEVAAAVRPNYDPKVPFWYRIRRIEGAIVHKTHIVYPAGPDKLARIEELFFRDDWSVETLPPYGREASASPLETFAGIPAGARYRFMLDNAYYFVNTFIKGPVCKGQLATDVIEDHFFAFFQDPEHDRFVQDRDYAAERAPELHLPGKGGWIFSPKPAWLSAQQRYAKARAKAYFDQPARWEHLWHGEGRIPDALLTIFRHFDSATVVKGLQGGVAKNAWVIDYPLFERIYYVLVVNFNEFGSVTHQLQTRLYFDLLRAEGELNFLAYMPAEARKALRADWYRGSVAGLKKMLVYPGMDVKTPSALGLPAAAPAAGSILGLAAQDPREVFMDTLLSRTRAIAGPPDRLNRGDKAGPELAVLSATQTQVESSLRELAGVRAGTAPFVGFMPEITFVHVVTGDGQDLAYALTREVAHRNVAFMMREESRLEPEKDRLILTRGPLGSYPNFIFRVPADEVDTFVRELAAVRNQAGFTRVVDAFGIRRTHPDLWTSFHFFTEWMRRHDPVEAGVYDLNRYANF